jgi:hypothetical protein
MPAGRPCPFRDQPTNEGGYMDASVREHTEPVLQLTYRPACGTSDPDAPCAFRALLQQVLAHQELDRTQVCCQCDRVVRVHTVKIQSLTIGE